jgi:hypothetical protein
MINNIHLNPADTCWQGIQYCRPNENHRNLQWRFSIIRVLIFYGTVSLFLSSLNELFLLYFIEKQTQLLIKTVFSY